MPDGHAVANVPRLPADLKPLEVWFADRMGAREVSVCTATLLPGGAVQRNWRLTLDADGWSREVVLRIGPDIALPESRTKAEEFAVLRHAHAAGVPVAEPLWVEPRGEVIGRPFLVSAFCVGNADRQALFARPDNDTLLAQLGAVLARVHGAGLPEGLVPETPRERVDILQQWACDLDSVPRGIAAGLDWLDANTPEPAMLTLVHRDFRTGNFLTSGGHLEALLDWEFAAAGDPHEDIGWFCAECWRGENVSREAGGLGDRAVFLDAYVAADGAMPDPQRTGFWEVFAHIRWALIAMQQARRAEAGEYPDWELKEAGNRVPGLARDIETMIGS
jgi:aminoglycoside phosphotransferase (APT) family kinase protein